jgi:hypothetical protein
MFFGDKNSLLWSGSSENKELGFGCGCISKHAHVQQAQPTFISVSNTPWVVKGAEFEGRVQSNRYFSNRFISIKSVLKYSIKSNPPIRR